MTPEQKRRCWQAAFLGIGVTTLFEALLWYQVPGDEFVLFFLLPGHLAAFLLGGGNIHLVGTFFFYLGMVFNSFFYFCVAYVVLPGRGPTKPGEGSEKIQDRA